MPDAPKMMPVPRGKRGFTLMEVALTLVVIAIVAVSLISMLGMALDSDRMAGRDTVLVSMSAQVLNRMRAVPFDALWLADPTATPNPAAPGASAPIDTTWYFSDDGTLLAGTGTAVPPEALFRCVVKKLPDDKSRAVPTAPYNRVMLTLEFSWPISAATSASARPNLQILHASIARY